MFRFAPMVVVTMIAVLAAACGDDDGATSTGTASPSASVTDGTEVPTATASAVPTPTLMPDVAPEVACPSADDSKGNETSYLRTGWELGDIICWTDAGGEVAYRINGTVVYWIPPEPQKCSETPRPRPTFGAPFQAEFSEELPANTTRIHLPLHTDDAVAIKDYTILIEALDSAGDVITSGAAGLTRDAFCESE